MKTSQRIGNTFVILFVSLAFVYAIAYHLSNHRSGDSTEQNSLAFPMYADEKTMTAENAMAIINQERTSNNLHPLRENPSLNNSACAKLDDMVANDYWEHVSPEGTTPWYWFNNEGITVNKVGENLAYGVTNPRKLVDSWMLLPTHRDNILEPRFNQQGMCMQYVYFQGSHRWLIVSHFWSGE